jgi:hypothetical protein
MAVFAEVETQKFVDQMVVHLKKFFPKQCEAMGEPQLRDTIQYGIKRAAAYGITAQCDVRQYMNLIVVFGRDFDTDKRLPWASEILNRSNSPSIRTCLLLQSAKRHLREG